MADPKDYVGLSIKELEEYIGKKYADVLASYPLGVMEIRKGIVLTTLEDGSLYLDTLNIRTAAQGQGKGKEILNIVKNWADANKVAVYIKPAYLPDNPTFKGIETTPERQVENLFNYYKNNGWEDNPNFTSLSPNEQSAQLSLSARAEWGASTDDLYSPLVYTPEGVDIPELPKNPYINDIISSAEKFNIDGKAFVDGYNQPILDETIQGILKIEPFFGLEGYGLNKDVWKKSKFSEISNLLEQQGIHPSAIEDISKYIPRDKILTPAQIFKGNMRNEYFTDEIVEMLKEDVGGFYELDDAGDELFPQNKPKRNYRLYYIISQGDDVGGKLYADYVEDISGPFNKNPEPTKWVEYLVNGERTVDIPDTPTNVVDDGIELYHSRSKGIETPRDFHAGTYQAAVDRSAFMFGDTNMYQLIINTQELAQEQVNDMLSEIVSDSTGKFEDGKYLEREILVDLPNGSQQPVNVLVETIDDTGGYKVMILDKDNFGFTIYSEDGFGEAPANKSLLEVNGNAVLVGEADDTFGYVAGFKPENKTFNYKDGYELYKVEIKANTNVVTFTENIELVENGVKQNIDPDLFVNYLEMNLLTDIDSITLPDGKTIDLQGLSDTEKRNKLKNNIDVIGYRNQMEDVGSTSYYFLNNDAYTETLVDNATNTKFDNDVLKKFINTNPNVGITDFKRASDERLNIVTDLLSSKTDTPTNVVDDAPLLETRMKINSDSNIPRERGIVRWADDVITPNKIFNPDSFTRIQEQGFRVWTKTTEFNYEEMYKRLLNNTATDEDITKFFIFTAGYSPTKAFAYKSFQDADARADIVKIGIFSDKPIIEIIPMGDQFNEREFLANLLSRNPQIKQEDITRLLVELVNEQGQFANLKERMRNVLINAHKEIYKNNPNDYFILWRGGNLNRFYPWQSFSKKLGSAWTVANQMNQVYSGGSSVNSFIINKNNMIDLDALGLSHMDEQEVIVLTEEAKSQYAQRPKNIELAKDIDNINDWWLEARQTDAFTKQGQNITNISAPIADAGQSTQDWFNTVLQGIDERYRPKKPYEQIIDLDNPKFYKWQDDYNKLVVEGGNFNQHIFTSIPTFYETQIVKGLALSNLIDTLPNVTATGRTPDGQLNYFTILDIGGTEGTWAKALAKNNPNIDVTVLDPLQSARDTFENGEYVSNARYEQKAFSYLPEDADRFFKETGQAPVRFETFNSNFRYNVVHESMAFQFIDSNRVEQIKFIKENVLAEDGILIIEEKFLNTDSIYKANEQLKNEFKSQYYTQEQLNNKKLEVLLSMENNQVSVQEIEKILGENFANVQQYWDSGNFKGYIASDSDVVNQFVPEINNLEVSLTDHRFSTNPTNNEIRAAVQNKIQQHGTDSKLAAQIAEETVAQSPQYFNKLSKIAARFGVVGGTALAGLAKLAPALAPGDFAIEKAIEKSVPYLDDAAAKLGFARIPFKNLLPTYMAYEIGVAGADIIQAAMYAYDKSQQLPKPSAAAFGSDTFQESLTRLLLPKAYEEEAIKRSQVPGDLLAFYQTPTGKRIVEEMKFGNQFMKELDQEKISKYSPGWGLTKGLLSILGELAQYEAPEVTLNSSDYTTKLKENPAMIYNAGITGSNK